MAGTCILRAVPVVMATLSPQYWDVGAACEFPVGACGVKPSDFAGFVNVSKQMFEFWVLLNVSPDLDSHAGN